MASSDVADRTTEVEVLKAQLAVLELRPGDHLVLTYPGRLSDYGRQSIAASMKELLPGRKVIVLDDGMTIGVVRETP